MKKSANAFTLIELLVVITIIAILAGIALPVFSNVQEKARATQDANNLRQIGIGVTAYLNDHDDTIFVTGSSFAPLLNPQYIAVWKTFQSPFDTRTASETPASAPVSYDLNRNIVHKSSSDIASASNCIMIAPLISKPYPHLAFAGKITSSPQLDKTSNAGNSGGTHNRGKRINVLFFDAHVESLLMSDFHSSITNTNPATKDTVSDLHWNVVNK